jgi:hypothetical protein
MKPLILSATVAFIAGSLSVGCATVASSAGRMKRDLSTPRPTELTGQSGPSQSPDALVDAAVGACHVCTLDVSGHVRCRFLQGESGRGGKALENCGPTADWGQAEPPADVHAVQIVTGVRHGCALTVAKGVQCWGLEHGPHAHRIWREYPSEVELLTPATAPLGEFTQVWAAADSTCAAAASGDSIICWGWGYRWAVALDRPFVAVGISRTRTVRMMSSSLPGRRSFRDCSVPRAIASSPLKTVTWTRSL